LPLFLGKKQTQKLPLFLGKKQTHKLPLFLGKKQTQKLPLFLDTKIASFFGHKNCLYFWAKNRHKN
jgi:hypothetical protein